jgi:hypothetical protein
MHQLSSWFATTTIYGRLRCKWDFDMIGCLECHNLCGL